jgi:DNA-binding transcriptional LysR family regulator
MTELDLNLLRVLVALDECRSVSTAAIRLQRSQPAVSAALGKLRSFFEDPLFVRSGNTMQPTPRVNEMIGPVRDVLSRIGTDIIAAPTFDPTSNQKTVVVALSDVGEVVFLPALLNELRHRAPQASVRSVSLPAPEVADGLETGIIDIAVGYFPDLTRHNFFQHSRGSPDKIEPTDPQAVSAARACGSSG